MSNHEWLSLIDVSGPFLALPVLDRAFPQGLEPLDPQKKKDLRQAYDEWREAQDLDDVQQLEIHHAWIDLVLKQGLELDEDGEQDTLKPREMLPDKLSYLNPEFGTTLRPDYAVVDDQKDDAPLLLISVYDSGVDIDASIAGDGWSANPVERMVQLCRATETRLGLITNGERWMLIDAPVGAVTTFASWYARLWSQEPITLQAFVTLLGIRRFFIAKDEQLPALLDESLKHQDEVTEALGEQVRRAVEVLIQALDRADIDRNRTLLKDIKPSELYESALTVMMRLVFLLSAEERELMDVVKDERFQANYAVSSLRMQLREQAGLHSEEILSHRCDAWSRLLAIFRAIYGGIEHETLRMPALGGSLFDPDRFPFLEGREKDSSWITDEAKPLPIDNRTVLLLLDAIQLFHGRTLSYRALDVENIGYVYEGLLERTVERAKEVTLDLDATKSAKKPWVSLDELDAAKLAGNDAVEKLLKERTGSSISRVRRDLNKDVDPVDGGKLLTACHNNQELCSRIEPYFHLLRMDSWGFPLVYPVGAYMVTTGADRRETGTHYTPKSLTEAIVKETLEPIVYTGPAEGSSREEWKLKPPEELLELKICDPAMGSGAFLVQACRWLSERLVEAWEQVESDGRIITVDGKVLDKLGAYECLPLDPDERIVIARRLIAERCLYGVDINPLAVELAKLSIWLITLAKGRPFGFLDHNLRSGDSLLGLTKLEQLYCFDLHADYKSSKKLFAQKMDEQIKDALSFRKQLREIPIRDIRDVQCMERLDQQARQKLEHIEHIADAMIGEALASGGNQRTLNTAMKSLSTWASAYIEGDNETGRKIIAEARKQLSIDLPAGKSRRKPFHWVLEFPEVFRRECGGFDGLVGNPPFLGGKRISGSCGGGYLEFLKVKFHAVGATTDLCAYFFRQSFLLMKPQGHLTLLATNTISEGDTRAVGLAVILDSGTITYAIKSLPWPGKANLSVSIVSITNGPWGGNKYLNTDTVSDINAMLSQDDGISGSLNKLSENAGCSYMGSIILGEGFVLDDKMKSELCQADANNENVIFYYMNGRDLTTNYDQSPSRWVINFGDMSEKQASKYGAVYDLVKTKVKPQRDKVKRKAYREKWWQFAEKCTALYEATGAYKEVLVCGNVSKYLNFCFVPNDKTIFTANLFVFDIQGFGRFGCLQSTLHEVFARKFSSTLETRLSYSPRDAFEPFPFPRDVASVNEAGERYHSIRKVIMEKKRLGLTSLYNLFHNPCEVDGQICSLRDAHRDLDESVLHAYGWGDLNLAHDFHEVTYLPEKDCVRYTISEEARREVLQRLLKLNYERYEEEVAQGLHNKKKTTTKRRSRKAAPKQNALDLGDLLNFDPEP